MHGVPKGKYLKYKTIYIYIAICWCFVMISISKANQNQLLCDVELKHLNLEHEIWNLKVGIYFSQPSPPSFVLSWVYFRFHFLPRQPMSPGLIAWALASNSMNKYMSVLRFPYRRRNAGQKFATPTIHYNNET